ncbi:MAG TPA: phage holin family protein [Pirellulaceae bacterium]|nr:phage holin family protein [Pirellulaceae bacterium]
MPCPTCGSPITVAGPRPAGTPFATHPAPPPNPHGTASQQFRRNPFWYVFHGVEMPQYQAGCTPRATRRTQKRMLAGLGVVVLGLALLTFAIAAARFGLWFGLGFMFFGLGVAFVPLLFGFYFVAAGLLESDLLMMSRKGRGVRYLFGDQGARWFFIIAGCPMLLIGLMIQLGFVAGAAIGRDPNRNRNAPVQAADDRPQHVPLDAAQAAANDRARKQMIEDFRRENADLLQNPEVAAEFEKKLREQFPDRKAPAP